MSQPTFYFPLNIQIAPYTARIMIKYKNMMLYMLVNNYQLNIWACLCGITLSLVFRFI